MKIVTNTTFVVILFYNWEKNNNNYKIIIIFFSFFLWQEGWISQRKTVTPTKNHSVIILWGWWSDSPAPPGNACPLFPHAVMIFTRELTPAGRSAATLWTLSPIVCQTLFEMVLLPHRNDKYLQRRTQTYILTPGANIYIKTKNRYSNCAFF